MSLDKALAYVQKELKNVAVRPLSAYPNIRVSTISSRSLILDTVLGRGGWPRGHIVELFGGENAGKTTLLYHAIAEAQSRGETCAFIDAEHRVDPVYAAGLGVDVSKLIFTQPSSGEEGMEVAEALLRSNEVGLLAIDSVDAIRPRSEEEGSFGDANVGKHAKLINEVCRCFSPIKGRCCILFTNQIRENPGKMFGNPEYQPGGRAMKFYASIRLELRRGEYNKDDDEQVIGNVVKLKCVKNSIAPPFRTGELELVYGKGIDMIKDTFEAAKLAGFIKQKGSFFKLVANGTETSIGQGTPAVLRWLSEKDRVKKLRLFILESDWYKKQTGQTTSGEREEEADYAGVPPASEVEEEYDEGGDGEGDEGGLSSL